MTQVTDGYTANIGQLVTALLHTKAPFDGRANIIKASTLDVVKP